VVGITFDHYGEYDDPWTYNGFAHKPSAPNYELTLPDKT